MLALDTGILRKLGGRKDGGDSLCDALGIESVKKWRTQHVSCYRAGNEMVRCEWGEIGSQEQ